MPNKQQLNIDPDLRADDPKKELYHDEPEDDSGQLHPPDGHDPDTDIVEGDLKNDAVLSGEFVSDLTTNPPKDTKTANEPGGINTPGSV